MISRECFTREWIDGISDKYSYPDKNLIEKVIRAFSLVEMLVESGCDFCWKGGTSLMVILGQSLHRLSIDVDIICPPGTDIEQYLSAYADYGFVSKEENYREHSQGNLPATHSKFHYQISFKDGLDRTEYILLDVLYEDIHYRKVNSVPLVNPMVKWENEPVIVKVPSVEDILGDKLTAFAPNTCGIPYVKNGKSRSLEIIKQLFDIGRLFDNFENLGTVRDAYRSLVPIEMAYRNMPGDYVQAANDILDTAIAIATRGKSGVGDFASLQNGINRLKSFMYMGTYYIENAIRDAGKAAYLATLMKDDSKKFERYAPESTVVSTDMKLPSAIRKLAMSDFEAYYYWVKAING